MAIPLANRYLQCPACGNGDRFAFEEKTILCLRYSPEAEMAETLDRVETIVCRKCGKALEVPVQRKLS